MAFPVPTGSHCSRREHPEFSAFSSSNRPFKKHFAALEVLSEGPEENDACSVSEGSDYSICSSPTCAKESSSDEGAKLLFQPFASSEISRVYGKKEKVPQISQTTGIKAAAQKVPRGKVSFQVKAAKSCEATQRSRTEMSKFSALGANVQHCGRISSGRSSKSGNTRVEAELQNPPSASSHVTCSSGKHCFPLMSRRVVDLLHRHCSRAILKLRGFICRHRQEGMPSEEGQLQLSNMSLDDVNEMKAILSTINQNLNMLESRSKAHPRLLTSTLAPVYFTT